MPIELKMPALSPTMEEGTLAKWLVKEGDEVKSGDILAEIETDKATMEFEAVDEGKIAKILVPEGTDGVKVGAPIAIMAGEGEDASVPPPPRGRDGAAQLHRRARRQSRINRSVPSLRKRRSKRRQRLRPRRPLSLGRWRGLSLPRTGGRDGRPDQGLAARAPAGPGAEHRPRRNQGSGPGGRIVRADIDAAAGKPPAAAPAQPAAAGHAVLPGVIEQAIPHEAVKLSNMRKTIARRLTESKQQVPHIYLTVDINLDALLKLRADLNKGLESRGVKLSVNDLLIKALAQALIEVPECNVSFAGDQLFKYSRADISVAVSIPAGLITPIIVGAEAKTVSAISTEMKDLAGRAKEGKLQPQEYQGGTASLSNMGMFGIKQFEAVINPPQGMIMAIGAGEKRPYVINDSLQIATIMSATGSFDHRAIDGADGAKLMQAFKRLVENPLGMLA